MGAVALAVTDTVQLRALYRGRQRGFEALFLSLDRTGKGALLP
jgi:hypothetical protein